MNKLFPILPQTLPNVINAVYPKIDAATAHSDGKYIGPDIVRLLISGHMQLWAAVEENDGKINGISITEIANFPQRKVGRMLAATGEDAAGWVPLLTEIEAWEKAQGCTLSEIVCRPGWEKVLKPFGYKKTHVLLSKELNA